MPRALTLHISRRHRFPNLLIGCYRAVSQLKSLDFVLREANLNKIRRLIARSFPRCANYSKYIFVSHEEIPIVFRMSLTKFCFINLCPQSLKLSPAELLDALAPWSVMLNNIRDIVSPADEFERLNSEQQSK